jgi:hypothetical protein
VCDWPVPVSVKELRSFVGLTWYYNKFICHFAILTKPLTELLRKGVLYVWTSDHDTSFAAIKQALCTTPVLALSDFTKPFCIETDACKADVGAILFVRRASFGFH